MEYSLGFGFFNGTSSVRDNKVQELERREQRVYYKGTIQDWICSNSYISILF